MMAYRKDLSGKRFGRLIVLEPTDEMRQENVVWKCLCDCGKIYRVITSSLNRGHTRSCGCLHIDTASELLEKVGRQNRMNYGEASFRDVLRIYKRNAKDRMVSFELTTEEFAELTKKNCYYCGAEPAKVNHPTRNYGPYIYNGIDRVDNTKGYILENCVTCCMTCNKMKVRLDINNFLDHIRKINKHLLMWEVT